MSMIRQAGGCADPQTAALMTQPGLSPTPPAQPVPPPPDVVGPLVLVFTITQAIRGYGARRLASGAVELAVGQATGLNDGLIGVYASNAPAMSFVYVAKTGATLLGTPYPPAKLFRSATGAPVPYSLLLPPPPDSFTNWLGRGSAAGMDVQIDQEQQIYP